jgi:hypothetical protein
MRDYRNRAEMAAQFNAASGMKKGDRMGGCLQVVPFYRHTRNEDTWGKGLGVNSLNTFSTAAGAVGATLNVTSVSSAALVGDGQADTNGGQGVAPITLKPQHYAIGANVNYHQCLNELYEGLYLSVNTAIAQDNRKDNLAIGTVAGTNAPSALILKAAIEENGTKKGRYSSSGTWKSRSGLEDPEIFLGYNFVDSDSAKASLNLAGVIATGNDPELLLINEPLVGGKHFKLGAGLSACANLMDDEGYSLKAHFDANYRYAFERKVPFLPGLKNVGWGHLAKTVADTAIGESVADVYGGDAKVKPGSQFDGYAMLCYCMDNFCLDLGYHLEFKSAHTPTMEATFVAKDRHIGDNAAAANARNVNILAGDLVTKREQVLRHSFVGNAGMTMRDWDYPVMFGVGGSFDVASKKQITPENWQVHGKVGVCF